MDGFYSLVLQKADSFRTNQIVYSFILLILPKTKDKKNDQFKYFKTIGF